MMAYSVVAKPFFGTFCVVVNIMLRLLQHCTGVKLCSDCWIIRPFMSLPLCASETCMCVILLYGMHILTSFS